MKDFFEKQEEQYYVIPKWQELHPNMVVGFTSKNGGESKGAFQTLNTGFHVHDDEQTVVANRQMIADKLNFPLSDWVGAEQTHKTNIIKVTNEHKGLGSKDYHSALKDTDGLYTNSKGILLTLCFADCVPIYYFAPAKGYIGIVHAGWKGTVSGIAGEMIQKWQEEGIAAEDIYTAIGPSICQNCYVVDDKVIQEVNKVVEVEAEKPYNLISEGQYKLDLKKCNEMILRAAGLKHIDVTNLCTSCQETAFFSHRRDQGKTGRLMSFIGWKEASL